MTGSVRAMLMLWGPLIWFLHFSFLYGAAGFGGALGFSSEDIKLSSWIATAVGGLALGLMLWHMRSRRDAIVYMANGLAWLSLVAVVFQALVLSIMPF